MTIHHARSRLSAITIVAGMLATPSVYAQFEPPVSDQRLNFVGLLVGYAPDYSGSKDNEVGLAPLLRYQFEASRRFVLWQGPKLELNLIDDDTWNFGPMLSFRAARDNDVDNRVVRQMDKIDSEVAVGAFVLYNLRLGPEPMRQLVFGADASTASNGAFYTAKMTYWHPFSPQLTGTIGVGTSYGNNKYMRTYYGVTGSDITLFPSLGGNAYNAKSGLIGVNIPVGLSYTIDRRWILSGLMRYEKLQGDAKDSPIVSQEGDSNQWTYGLGLSYIF